MPPGVTHGSYDEERNLDDAFEDDSYSACNTPDKTELRDLRTLHNAAVDSADRIMVDKNKAICEARIQNEKYNCEADVDEHDINEREETDSLLNGTGAKSPNDPEFKEGDTKEGVVEESSVAPDGGWGWFIILGALCLRIIMGTYKLCLVNNSFKCIYNIMHSAAVSLTLAERTAAESITVQLIKMRN